MANGYYGEAELIVYAFLEDRLRSFLYYSKALDSRNSRTINDDMQSICGRVDSINTTTFEERSIDLILRETNYLDYMFRLLPYDKFCSIFCIDKSKFSEKDLESLYTRSIDLADEVDSFEQTNEYINECFPDIGYERFIEICNYRLSV